MLDRVYDAAACKRFWKRKCLPLLLCTMVWWVIYDVFLYVSGRQPFTLTNLAANLLFFRPVNLGHSWYMPMILSLYLLIPFVAAALQALGPRMLALPLAVFTVYEFGFPFVNMLHISLGGSPFDRTFISGFSGQAYGIYLIFGYLVRRGCFKRIRTAWIGAGSLLGLAGTVLFHLWLHRQMMNSNTWYDSPLLLMTAVCLFELLSRVRRVPMYRAIRFVSYYSFAVYLIHNLVLYTLYDMLGQVAPPSAALLPCIAVITALSLLLAWGLGHIPRVGRFLLYLR